MQATIWIFMLMSILLAHVKHSATGNSDTNQTSNGMNSGSEKQSQEEIVIDDSIPPEKKALAMRMAKVYTAVISYDMDFVEKHLKKKEFDAISNFLTEETEKLLTALG